MLSQGRPDAPRGFAASLAGHRAEGLGVIAEVKRRSPSLGPLVEHLEVEPLVDAYRSGGASCLSVLTDATSFGGSAEDLAAARATVALPVLRKDFTVAPNDVADAWVMGADAVLLIAAVLDDGELARLSSLAHDLGLDVLCEVHDQAELERALSLEVAMIGVNQRDLVTFKVDHDRAVHLAAQIPQSVVAVAESGVRGVEDATALAAAGYDAVLVGEHLVKADDPSAALGALVGHRIGSRGSR